MHGEILIPTRPEAAGTRGDCNLVSLSHSHVMGLTWHIVYSECSTTIPTFSRVPGIHQSFDILIHAAPQNFPLRITTSFTAGSPNSYESPSNSHQPIFAARPPLTSLLVNLES